MGDCEIDQSRASLVERGTSAFTNLYSAPAMLEVNLVYFREFIDLRPFRVLYSIGRFTKTLS